MSMISNQLPPAINWHLEPICNYDCKFCFATFPSIKKRGNIGDHKIRALFADFVKLGVQKINFVGGEPMLHPKMALYIQLAKEAGLITSLVSNGTKITKTWLQKMKPYLDWLGLSIDASTDDLHAKMGRGRKGEIKHGSSNHLKRSLEVWKTAKKLGYKLKLNTVVSKFNAEDNMGSLIARLQPDRWKVFQVLPIKGENDQHIEKLRISNDIFQAWLQRHKEHNPIAEDNDAMKGSYAMLDPLGRFFSNRTGILQATSKTVFSHPISEVWQEIGTGFSQQIFKERGGTWNWESSNKEPLSI